LESLDIFQDSFGLLCLPGQSFVNICDQVSSHHDVLPDVVEINDIPYIIEGDWGSEEFTIPLRARPTVGGRVGGCADAYLYHVLAQESKR
jgi:hypothetical protein